MVFHRRIRRSVPMTDDRTAEDFILVCPQCGHATSFLVEGYCHQCYTYRQQELDQHNAEHDEWSRLTDAERERRINAAIDLASNHD